MHFTRNVHYGTAQIVRAGGVCGHETMYDAQMRQYLLGGFFHLTQTEFNVLQTERERERESEGEWVSCSFEWVGQAAAAAPPHLVDFFNLSAVKAYETQINVPQIELLLE